MKTIDPTRSAFSIQIVLHIIAIILSLVLFFSNWEIVVAIITMAVFVLIFQQKNSNITSVAGSVVVLMLGAWMLTMNTAQASQAAPDSEHALTTMESHINETAIVTRIIDGDSIMVLSLSDPQLPEQEIRLIGVDTPEIVMPKMKMQCLGIEAADETNRLLLGKTVRLQREVTNTDSIGRLLRHVYVENDLVSEILLQRGLARVMTIEPNTRLAPRFEQLERQAKEQQLGVWAKHCFTNS